MFHSESLMPQPRRMEMTDTTQCNNQKNILGIAKEISKKFVSSVLLVDDHFIFSTQSGDDSTINAGEFINNLAKEKISVCPFLWSREEQFDSIANLIGTNDVSVFDWKIQLEDQYSDADLDADVKDSGDRGENAKRLILSIIEQNDVTPHLVIIYTQETTEVQKYLQSLHDSYPLSELQDDNHVLFFPEKNIRICLYFKMIPSKIYGVKETRVIHDSKEMISAIISEFAELHKGIVPLSLLHSLSILRQNTSKLLSIFNEDLDPAFVFHKAWSPEPTDADSLLVQTFLDAFSALFFYQKRDLLNSDALTQAWMDEQSQKYDNEKIRFTLKFNGQDVTKELTIDHNERKQWISKGYPLYLRNKMLELFSPEEPNQEVISCMAKKWISKNDKNGKIFSRAHNCFSLRDSEKMRIANESFAILTHHKSVFSPDKECVPVMMLGCIIQKTGGEEETYLCIQQPCDCLRITGERQFLFLPLSEVPNEGFDIIVNKNKRMVVNHKNSYSLKTIWFSPNNGDDVIKATKDNAECFYFTDIQDNKYIWCCDLKESFALKILNEYVQKLTRVGVDQSEWLRRS